MADPLLTVCEAGSTVGSATEYDAGNPIQLLNADIGIPTDPLSVDVWNDRDGSAGSTTAYFVKVRAMNDDDISAILAGTAGNGFQSMLEARSRGAFGVAADNQSAWTPISTAAKLSMGDIPAGCMRTLELRLNVPVDGSTISIKNFFVHVSGRTS